MLGHLSHASCLTEICDKASPDAGLVFQTNNTKWAASTFTHLILCYLKHLSGWDKAFSRLVEIVRAAVWMDVDIVKAIHLHGVASPPRRPRPHYIQRRLVGF